jgi:CRISPR/Cas system-associated protein Csm6
MSVVCSDVHAQHRFTVEKIAQLMYTLLVMPLSTQADTSQLNAVLHYVDATVTNRLVARHVREYLARFGDQYSTGAQAKSQQVRPALFTAI